MSTEPAFLAAIRAEPEAAAPRLVYADWLDEQGRRARAELVRIDVARTPLPAWDLRQIAHRNADRRVWRDARDALYAELPDVPDVQFQWGAGPFPFLAEVRSFERLIELQSTLADLGVDDVRVPAPSSVRQARKLEWLPSFGGLEVTGLRSADGERALAACPALEGLHRLWISGPGCEGHLFAARRFDELRALAVGNVPPSALDAVFSTSFPRLRSFDLWTPTGFPNVLSDHTVGRFRSWSALPTLETLRLSGLNQGDASWLRTPRLVALRDVSLDHVTWSTLPFEAPWALQLERLRVDLQGHPGLLATMIPDRVPALRQLVLRTPDGPGLVPDLPRGLQSLVVNTTGSPAWPLQDLLAVPRSDLHSLQVRSRRIVEPLFRPAPGSHSLDEALLALSEATMAAQLRTLAVESPHVRTAAVDPATYWRWLAHPGLEELRMNITLRDRSPEFVRALTSHPTARQLEATGGLVIRWSG